MAERPWPTIHAEREALADDLTALTGTQWAAPSLCEGRSVQQTLGHMAATAKLTPPAFLAAMARSGFRFEKMAAAKIAEETAGTPAQTLARFREQQSSTAHPPGPVDSWLGETIVHAEDIRRPLGIAHDYPLAAVTRLLDFYKGSNMLIGAKRRIAGVRLRATDTDWSTGEGPEVSGPALSLLMAMTGRSAGLVELSGPGLSVLRERV
jgi:uncharacterized protein (TIGR03083 family)